MARNFVLASSQYLSGGAPVTAYPFTMACWCNTTVVGTVQCAIFLGDSTAAANYWTLTVITTGPIRFVSRNTFAYSATTSTSLTDNAWQHLCAVGISSTSRSVYLNGGGVGSNTTNSTPVPTGIAVGMLRASTPVQAFGGAIAHVAIWRVALSAAEIALLAAGAYPYTVQPQDLAAYWPLQAATWKREWKGHYNLTPSASVPAPCADPPQIRRARLWVPEWLCGPAAITATVAESGSKATEAATAAISVAVIAAETGSKGTESIVGTVAIAATIAETGSEPTEAIEVTVVPAGAIVAETGSKPTEAVTGTVAIAGSVTEVGAKSTDAVTVTKALLPTFRPPSGPAMSAATLPGAGMIRVSYTSLPELARAVQELAFRLNDAITAAAAASAVPPTDPLPYLTYADGNTVTLEAGDPLLLGAQPTDTEYLGDAQGAPLLLADCRPMRLGASGVAQAEATRINELIRSGLMQWLPPEARRVTSETVDQYKNVPES